jgi:hypothetical protein
MAKKLRKYKRTVTFYEGHGQLPYLICWISANRTPTMLYKSTLEEVFSQKQHLLSLGFADADISIMINFSDCGVIDRATGKEK